MYRKDWQTCSEVVVIDAPKVTSGNGRRTNSANSSKGWNDRFTNCRKPGRKRRSLITCVSFVMSRKDWQTCSEMVVIDAPKVTSGNGRRTNSANSSKRWNDRFTNFRKPEKVMQSSSMCVSSIYSKNVWKACDERPTHGSTCCAETGAKSCRKKSETAIENWNEDCRRLEKPAVRMKQSDSIENFVSSQRGSSENTEYVATAIPENNDVGTRVSQVGVCATSELPWNICEQQDSTNWPPKLPNRSSVSNGRFTGTENDLTNNDVTNNDVTKNDVT